MALRHHLSSKANAVSFIMSFSVVTSAHHRASQIAPQGATAAEMSINEQTSESMVTTTTSLSSQCLWEVNYQWQKRIYLMGDLGVAGCEGFKERWEEHGGNKETDKGAWYHGKFVFIFTKML